jgi:hypothetical protein
MASGFTILHASRILRGVADLARGIANVLGGLGDRVVLGFPTR